MIRIWPRRVTSLLVKQELGVAQDSAGRAGVSRSLLTDTQSGDAVPAGSGVRSKASAPFLHFF